MGRKIHEDGSKAGKGMSGCWRIAREISEMEYNRGTDGRGKTEKLGIGVVA